MLKLGLTFYKKVQISVKKSSKIERHKVSFIKIAR